MSDWNPRVYVYKKSNSKFYWLKYQLPDGTWKSLSSKKTRKRDAEREATELEEKLPGIVSGQSEWLRAVEDYKKQKLKLKSNDHKKAFNVATNRFDHFLEPLQVRDFNSKNIATFIEHLVDEDLSESTIKTYLTYLRGFSKWLVESKKLNEKPIIELPKIDSDELSKGRPITLEEFERMLAAVELELPYVDVSQWHRSLRGIWLSGFRLSEAINFWWDRDDKIMPYNLTDTDPTIHLPSKQNKRRKVIDAPITPDFVEFLRKTPANQRSGKVYRFPRQDGKDYGPARVSRLIAAFGERAGIIVDVNEDGKTVKFASAQDLRRSFAARWALRVKLPILLQKLMRHRNIETTMKYYATMDAKTSGQLIRESVSGQNLVQPFCDSFGDSSEKSRESQNQKSP